MLTAKIPTQRRPKSPLKTKRLANLTKPRTNFLNDNQPARYQSDLSPQNLSSASTILKQLVGIDEVSHLLDPKMRRNSRMVYTKGVTIWMLILQRLCKGATLEQTVSHVLQHDRHLLLPLAHLAALRFLRLAIPQRSLVVFAPWQTSEPPRPGVVDPVSPAGISLRRQQDLPSSWGTSMVRLPCSKPTPAGLLAPDQSSAAAWPLVIERQRLPRLGLSTLNSMAFGLAVYASQDGLPHHHARLASSCWSGSTGRASHPQGSDEGFQSCCLHLIPPSQALLGANDATNAPKTANCQGC